jgi:ABC-type polysaccharide/polyol phosphate export permease
MTDFVEIARLLLYELRLPPPGPVLYCVAWTLVMGGAAVLVYRRWGRDVSEAL